MQSHKLTYSEKFKISIHELFNLNIGLLKLFGWMVIFVLIFGAVAVGISTVYYRFFNVMLPVYFGINIVFFIFIYIDIPNYDHNNKYKKYTFFR